MRPPAGGILPPAGSRLLLWIVLTLVAVACGGADDAATSTTTLSTTTTASVDEPLMLDVQGHRGARGLVPENTLPSFETALDLGVTTLELDLHFTADNEVVVWHDAVIDGDKCRLTPDAPEGAPDPSTPLTPEDELAIRNLGLEDLAAYRCDLNPSSSRYPDQEPVVTAVAGDNYGIVTLDELFAFVVAYAESDSKTEAQREAARNVEFNIETKRKADRPETIGDGFDGVNAGPFELAVLGSIQRAELTDRVVVQSFDHRSLWAIRAEDPAVRLAALSVRDPVDHADLAARGAVIWSPNGEAITSDTLAAAHSAGLLVIPWTINEPDEMNRLIELGVDGLITDRPDILLDITGSGGAP